MQFNLFRNSATDGDAFELITSLTSTRIYLLLLCVSITIIIIFTGLETQVHSVTIHKPSQIIYEDLYENYPDTLQCPCSQIAIHHGSFLSLSPMYHPVCSSAYLSFDWINSIEGTVNLDFSYSYTDFHVVGQAFFSAVATLCSLAQSTLSDQLYIFNRSVLIADKLLPKEELMIRTGIIFDQFESNTGAQFRRVLSLIQFHTQIMLSTSRGNADLRTYQLIDNVTQVILIDAFLKVAMLCLLSVKNNR